MSFLIHFCLNLPKRSQSKIKRIFQKFNQNLKKNVELNKIQDLSEK